MEEYVRLNSDELRNPLEEERAKFAEKQKVLLEAKSKINRGKLSSVSNATEKTLGIFLRSCCEETEKEQVYVSTVIERVRATAERTKNNLEKVNQHAQELLRNVGNDVLELSDKVQRVKSTSTLLSSVLEKRESRGRALKEREENTLRSSTEQFDRAKTLLCKIDNRVDEQIVQLESNVAERTDYSSQKQIDLIELAKETDSEESALMKHQEEQAAVEDQYRKTRIDFDHLQTQLTNRSKAKECAESDQARIEMELIEFREETTTLVNLISFKIKSIEENEAQIIEVTVSSAELGERFVTTEAEVLKFENSLHEEHDSTKAALEEVLQTLEREVEEVSNQLSADTIRADVMDKMFGNDSELTLHEWKTSIENINAIKDSNKEISEHRNALLLELDAAKSELEKVRHDAKMELGAYNMAQSRIRNIKKRIQEDHESNEGNIKIADSRIAQSMKELEELTNSKCSERKNEFVTPNPARHSTLQDLRKASVEASRGLSDDSDAESVKKSVVDLPIGIVKRVIATQQCSAVRSPDVPLKDSAQLCAADGGTSSETIAMTGNGDGDITMEGIPLSASIDHASHIDKIENWIRDTPDNNSPASGTTAEMMDDRFPKNIFNETNALNETDITMDMEDGDMNLTMMDMPPPTANKTLSPPMRQTSSKTSIFLNDSDSDANASVWGDEF